MCAFHRKYVNLYWKSPRATERVLRASCTWMNSLLYHTDERCLHPPTTCCLGADDVNSYSDNHLSNCWRHLVVFVIPTRTSTPISDSRDPATLAGQRAQLPQWSHPFEVSDSPRDQPVALAEGGHRQQGRYYVEWKENISPSVIREIGLWQPRAGDENGRGWWHHIPLTNMERRNVHWEKGVAH